MTTQDITGTVADLTVGDRLLHLGGVGFAQLVDPAADPVLVADVRRTTPDTPSTDDAVAEVVTSVGTLYTHLDTEARALRDDTVTKATILLISRRRMLHATLTELGTPVVRRTPVDPGATCPAVTEQEWGAAPLIVIDAYLARTTLHRMWNRGDLTDRDQIVMVGTDPDDPRAFERRADARARTLIVLPHDEDVLRSLFRAATGGPGDRQPFTGILTPVTT